VNGAARRLPATEPRPADYLEAWMAIANAVPDVGRRIEALDPYSPAVRQLYAMARLNAEVNNGGFSQFFFNDGGVWLDEAIEGFGVAGLPEHQRLVGEVAEVGVGLLGELQAAWAEDTLEAYSAFDESAADLRPFDDAWYGLTGLDEALNRFVAEQAEAIWE
jgi:hypothetical protein